MYPGRSVWPPGPDSTSEGRPNDIYDPEHVELDDWQRLIRSYLVLGRRDAATDALDRGTDALGLDSEAAATLEAFGRANGLERTVQR